MNLIDSDGSGHQQSVLVRDDVTHLAPQVAMPAVVNVT
jgi:hypothetical protein